MTLFASGHKTFWVLVLLHLTSSFLFWKICFPELLEGADVKCGVNGCERLWNLWITVKTSAILVIIYLVSVTFMAGKVLRPDGNKVKFSKAELTYRLFLSTAKPVWFHSDANSFHGVTAKFPTMDRVRGWMFVRISWKRGSRSQTRDESLLEAACFWLASPLLPT